MTCALRFLAVLILLPVSIKGFAAEEGHVEGAHVHGNAELLLVQEGNLLEIELRSPAANMLGFEHKVSTDAQRASVKKAERQLTDGASLFKFKGVSCELLEHHLDFSAVLDHAGGKHVHSDHDDHSGHSNIEAHYRFHCEAPSKLSGLSTQLLTRFGGIESLQIEWIVDGRQGAVILDNRRKELQFR